MRKEQYQNKNVVTQWGQHLNSYLNGYYKVSKVFIGKKLFVNTVI